MKRTARNLVAVLLTTGLAFAGIGSGAAGLSAAGTSVNGGGTGCCRDAI